VIDAVREWQAPPGPGAALVVLVTLPTAAAPALARQLVEEGRAAGVNQLPGVRSIYRWEGRVEQADEALPVVKTTLAGYPALAARVRELHPYEVPEILALPVVAGDEPYLEWLKRSVIPA
jgi:periplasmic divalent cation tolerance protein